VGAKKRYQWGVLHYAGRRNCSGVWMYKKTSSRNRKFSGGRFIQGVAGEGMGKECRKCRNESLILKSEWRGSDVLTGGQTILSGGIKCSGIKTGKT